MLTKKLSFYDSSNLEELCEKCLFYFENQEERFKIVQAGFEHALKHHAYLSRVDDVLEQIKKRDLNSRAFPGNTKLLNTKLVNAKLVNSKPVNAK